MVVTQAGGREGQTRRREGQGRVGGGGEGRGLVGGQGRGRGGVRVVNVVVGYLPATLAGPGAVSEKI